MNLNLNCCEQINNPNNKWLDCQKCENTKFPCDVYFDNCDSVSDLCQQENGNCINKPDSNKFIKSVNPCNINFSRNFNCVESPIERFNPNIKYPREGFNQPVNNNILLWIILILLIILIFVNI